MWGVCVLVFAENIKVARFRWVILSVRDAQGVIARTRLVASRTNQLGATV